MKEKDIEISYLIEAENPSLEVLIKAQKKLDNGWDLWKSFESKKVIAALKESDETPSFLKALFAKNDIASFVWIRNATNAEFMPDFCETLEFHNESEEHIFSLVISLGISAEDAMDFGLIAEGDITVGDTEVLTLFLEEKDRSSFNDDEMQNTFDFLKGHFCLSQKVDNRLKNYNY